MHRTDQQIHDTQKDEYGTPAQPTDRILTLPNLISFIRLCLIPLFFVVLIGGHDVSAMILFALAAGTDWIDGQVARRTHSVSKLGRMLDPAVDRLLMIFGVLGVFLIGRVPLWIIAVIVCRDAVMMAGYALLRRQWNVHVDVIYPGKVATTCLFVGFAALILNWPQIAGLGMVDVAWLPGFNHELVGWGIWFVYAGMLLGVFTTSYYVYAAISKVRQVQQKASV
ncbi:phosphatidylglycerophosphate synthase [Cryptobacterium curtum DSM 15641]|uniref:Phosphatidylglycerophosphate synthase n=1 Tax=Cryptobacterium curtum (strain ATCC 700683 / DSM 15641 / CCUG 43107 / 12-3) TaxID=469378 RepID=C7MNE4_CRYCD|nr:CDP-alcohol phosphatidyltransferase family protein [Cryptobacterium curtum]ACU94434.1 phosphatidylglycerophosphate synthase [Cryptobacterium curtum DSM 15641]